MFNFIRRRLASGSVSVGLSLERKKQIDLDADSLRKEFGVDAIFPVPVDIICEKLGYSGGRFTPTENTKNISGAVNHKTKKVYLNSNDSNERRRFTLAHEIAHIKYHATEESSHIDYRQDGNSCPQEVEANYFAAALTMPSEIFRVKAKENDNSPTFLSDYFDVSYTAAKLRLKEIMHA